MILALLACAPDPAPAGRYSHVGVVDAAAVLHVAGGASTGTGKRADTWSYDLASGGWQRGPDAPEPIFRATATRDGDVAYVFGGTGAGDVESARLYRWELSTGEWTLLDEGGGPPPRYKHAAARIGRLLLVHGGRTDDGEEAQVYGDLWAWDLDGGGWTELAGPGGPGARYRQGLAGDEARGVAWLHGGIDAAEERRADLWALDLEAGEWTAATGQEPGVRASHTLVATPDGPLLWGGTGDDDRAWTWTEGGWSAIGGAPAPLPRDAQVGDLTPDGGALVIMGGDPWSEEVPDFVADLWTLDLATGEWTERSGSP